MQLTRLLQHRQPMIRFLGKRTAPAKLDHAPHTHPAAPNSLPTSFAAYRQKAQQHGPLNTSFSTASAAQGGEGGSSSSRGGAVGGASGASLGPVEPARGLFFDISELPLRFRRRPVSVAEIEAVESAGGSLFA